MQTTVPQALYRREGLPFRRQKEPMLSERRYCLKRSSSISVLPDRAVTMSLSPLLHITEAALWMDSLKCYFCSWLLH